MKHCNKCNLDVNTFKKTCPLCGELLDSDSEQCDVVLYPKYKVKAKKKNMALRVILFLLIVASNFLYPPTFFHSPFYLNKCNP